MSENQSIVIQESFIEENPLTSPIIENVCDQSLFNGICENHDCHLLHLSESVRLTDGHFHDRLLPENWSCTIESLKNIEQFIGITNVHRASMWDTTYSIIPDSLKSRIRLYEAYGIHPRYLDEHPHNDLLRLRHLIQTRPMVAIGECGLDQLNHPQLSLQIEIFSSQIQLANEFHLPLILHSRQLDQQALDILKSNALDSSMKIQWHCCHSRGVNVYNEFLKYFPSSLLSVGGMCCQSRERNLQCFLRRLDPKRFVYETDSPYLKPSSLLTRSERNCPILGTLTTSAYITRHIFESNQWIDSIKLNTNNLQEFFNLI